MARKKKNYDDDDGRTIIDMNVEGMPWYQPSSGKKVDEKDRPNRKERRAMIWAAFRAYLPVFLTVLVGVAAAFGLLYCWLNGWFIK